MITVADIFHAQRRIRPHIFRTPLRYSFLLSERYDASSRGAPISALRDWDRDDASGASVHLKLENWQITGSFKPRGALNVMAMLNADERTRGVVTASAGNHALGVAHAARALNLSPVTIFVPQTAPRSKVDKLREFDVDVRAVGETYDDAHHAAEKFQRETGATYVHAYDDPRTVAGQGTIGLEILEDLPNVDAIIVPVGGGGMITGIAIAAKALAPATKIIGVQPSASPSLRDSLRDNKCYAEYAAAPTICDGLAGGIGEMVYEAAQKKLIDEVVLVDEGETKDGIRALAETQQLIVEGSGAVGVAALLAGRVKLDGKRVAVVISGGNIDLENFRFSISDFQLKNTKSG